jgi:ribosomal protein S18 acetylase RimI-like enzyme
MLSERADVRRYPPPLTGRGLVLLPWDPALMAQMAAWGTYGFPYHAFDLVHLRDPAEAQHALERAYEPGPHLHFVAVEDGIAVGRLSVNLRDSAGLYIWSVHVPPEQEGRGVCRRMMAVLMEWLESEYPGSDFVLTTNSFAEHAHRAYYALGFTIAETRWHFDPQLASALWAVPSEERHSVMPHMRFSGGQWQVRTHLMRRPPGARMATAPNQPRDGLDPAADS